jgi:ribosomal-protein-alanine N-acetyltransferase
MPELERLRPDHAPAVRAFELANRVYFAGLISDRGDDFFDHFDEAYNELLAQQEAGTCILHVLINEDGMVLGLFNLRDLEDGSAVLGYRVAQDAAGRGVATATVRELCQVAAEQYGLHTLRAATNLDNVASQRVLTKAGFVQDGPADPAVVGGRPGVWYRRHLAV